MVLSAATYIMNDDLESAEAGLKDGASSFHKVCDLLLTALPAREADGLGHGISRLMWLSRLDTVRKRCGYVSPSNLRIRTGGYSRRYAGPIS